MRTRISRSVGKPTAAVMRRTWRLRPSRKVSVSQLVGMLLRKRTGGSRGHNQSGSTACSAGAGKVGPSFSTTAQRGERRIVDRAIHLHQVGLGLLVARVGQPLLQPAVVGEQQQAFAVVV